MSAYSENTYTVYRLVVLKNSTLGTVDIIFINKINFLFFVFSDLQNLVKCMDSMVSCCSLLNMKVVWLYMVSAPLPITILHFHYFISLETANTQKIEVLLLRISLGNVNTSVVTCQYPQV